MNTPLLLFMLQCMLKYIKNFGQILNLVPFFHFHETQIKNTPTVYSPSGK